jgi:hypothetical protein
MVAACGIWCFDFQVVGMVWSWGLCVRFAGCCCWASNKICNKKHLLHLVGILFTHINDDAWSKSLKIYTVCCSAYYDVANIPYSNIIIIIIIIIITISISINTTSYTMTGVTSLKFCWKLTQITTLSLNTYSYFCETLEHDLLRTHIYWSEKKCLERKL